MFAMVSSVGLACVDAMELSAMSIVESTARPYYRKVPRTCWMYFFSFFESRFVALLSLEY